MVISKSKHGCLFGWLLGPLLGGANYGRPVAHIEQRGPLLSKAELRFYRSLVDAVAGRFEVMTKVRLGDLFKVRGDPSEATATRNRINQKHVDFVLCDLETMQPRVGIELDDRSHRSERARDADAVKNDAFERGGLPLVRVRAARSYDRDTLRRQIAQALRG